MLQQIPGLLHTPSQHQTERLHPVAGVLFRSWVSQYSFQTLLFPSTVPANPAEQLLGQTAIRQELNEEDLTEVPDQLHHGERLQLCSDVSGVSSSQAIQRMGGGELCRGSVQT